MPRDECCVLCLLGVSHSSPAQSDAAVVARVAAVVVALLAGVVGLLSKKIIVINRGKTTRYELMAKCEKHDRYLICAPLTHSALVCPAAPSHQLPPRRATVVRRS